MVLEFVHIQRLEYKSIILMLKKDGASGFFNSYIAESHQFDNHDKWLRKSYYLHICKQKDEIPKIDWSPHKATLEQMAREELI
jgi:hypothetical protein